MNGHLLLVEDELDALESLARAIERAGFRCTAAATLEGALAAAEQAKFIDVVVTDIVLGANDHAGIELVAALRTKRVDAPVIVITAFADVDKVKAALNAGASYLLEKPFRAAELLAVVRQVLATPRDVGHQVERTLYRLGLTEKELGVARHLLKGLTSAEIASLENNSEKTIRQHITRIYAKCGVTSRAEFFHYLVPI